MGWNEDRIAELQKDYDAKIHEYQSCSKQIRECADETLKVPWEQKKQRLKSECESIDKEIKCIRKNAINISSIDAETIEAILRTEWQEHIFKLDHENPEMAFKEVYIKRPKAILVLIKQSFKMKGELYVERIKKMVLVSSIYPRKVHFDLEPMVDEDCFITKHWEDLKPKSEEIKSGSDVLISIVRSLRALVGPGQTLCLESRLHNVKQGFLRWFLHEFWGALSNKFNNPEGPSVIYFLMFENDLPSDFVEDLCCSQGMFEQHKYFFINLTEWQLHDINDWMNIHINNSLEKYSLPRQFFLNLATWIYEVSYKGIPKHVHDTILLDIPRKVIANIGDKINVQY